MFLLATTSVIQVRQLLLLTLVIKSVTVKVSETAGAEATCQASQTLE